MAPWETLDDMELRTNVAVLISGIGTTLLTLWLATPSSTHTYAATMTFLITPPLAALVLTFSGLNPRKHSWGKDIPDFLHKWSGLLTTMGVISALYLALPWLLLVALPYSIILVWSSTGKSAPPAE